MARIFQKYVTSEGRSETPPEIIDSALKHISAGRKEGDPQPKLGGSSVKMSDLTMNGEREEVDDEDDMKEMDSMMSMYMMMKGMRSMMQFMKRMMS